MKDFEDEEVKNKLKSFQEKYNYSEFDIIMTDYRVY